MSSKIRVFGKTHNRTALGIINAYLIIYPETTLEQMRVIFPNCINPVSMEKEMFVDVTGESVPSKLEGYFTKREELLIMGDGKKVALISQWPLESLQSLIEKAKAYGIEIADFELSQTSVGCKGGYYIEFLDNWESIGVLKQVLESGPPEGATSAVPKVVSACTSPPNIPVDPDINSSPGNNSTQNISNTPNSIATMETSNNYDDSNLNWLWILIGLVVAGLFVWAICRSYRAHASYASMDGSEVMALVEPGQASVEALLLEIPQGQTLDGSALMDSLQLQARANAATIQSADGQQVDPEVYMARFIELQHQFNGIEYKNAKAVLSDSAKHVLNRVAALMEEYPSLDLRIEGHTSSVGRANYNQKLSQQRAQAVATYLQGKGIAADRLVAVGMGEAKPVDPANPNGSDNRVTCLFNISHNEARAQKESLADIVAQDVSEEGPITADF